MKKKKKLLSALLACTLVLSFLGSPVSLGYAQEGTSETSSNPETASTSESAATTPSNEAAVSEEEPASAPAAAPLAAAGTTVAMVDGQGFPSLQDAINSIPAEGTIQIVADIDLDAGITIPAGKSITITDDGTPHTVLKKVEEAFIFAAGGAELTIDGANLTFTKELDSFNPAASAQDHGGIVLCNGVFTLNNGTFDLHHKGVENVYGLVAMSLPRGVVEVSGQNAHFIMNGGTIQNAKATMSVGGVCVCNNAQFTMNGGTISGINSEEGQDAGAVLVYASDDISVWGMLGTATFVMNGGTIENNSGHRGAGVCVHGDGYTNRAVMEMNGGSIQNNTCTGFYTQNSPTTHTYFEPCGAGIYVHMNAAVTMNGGEIADNTVAGGKGGGVCAIDGWWPSMGVSIEDWMGWYPAEFVMNGGAIKNNSVTDEPGEDTGGCGGGICVVSNTMKLNGGLIEGNTANFQGGGVYVTTVPYTLTLNDVVIKHNEALELGGGIWACPTGATELFVTNGAAIYDNTADGAGDDVASVKLSGQNYALTLPERILGGGQALWYKDGGLKDDNSILGNPDNSPRYDPSGTNTLVSLEDLTNSTEPHALKAVVSDEAKALAEENAKLIIQNNRSPRGGGIGSNGAIIVGEKERDYTLKVKKAWENTDDTSKEPVTVYLKIGDKVLDPVTLNEGNNWQAEFTGLPDPATLNVSYAVVEDPLPQNFSVDYKPAVVDPATRIITIDVVNTQNAPGLGGLAVEKEVTGALGDKNKEFHFTITLDDNSVNGVYGEMAFVNGVAEVVLKHGEKQTAAGLPAGMGYTVVEEEANADGYKTTSVGATGTIPDNAFAEVKFVNHKDGPGIPKTGDPINLGLYALLLAASAFFFGSVVAARRKFTK